MDIEVKPWTPDDAWKLTWEEMARQGQCDTWGSQEQQQVTAEWVAAGRPGPFSEFILAHANRTA